MAFPHCDVRDLEGLLWTHVILLSFCVILIVASFSSQLKDAAPYGRHADPAKAKSWGFPIPQRVAHIVSDAIPGIPFLLAVYLLYAGLLPQGGMFSEVRPMNVVLLAGWLLHYLYRGIVHPLIMPYSSKTVAVGITLAGIFPNLLFSYLIAAQLACTNYPSDWASQPRFVIGAVLYGIGTVINRWADLKLRAGRLAMGKHRVGEASGGGSNGGTTGAASGGVGAVRESLLGDQQRESEGRMWGDGSAGGLCKNGRGGPQQQQQQEQEASGAGRSGAPSTPGGPPASSSIRQHYFIPRGGLYELVSCPNYLGELLEWTGYALAVWSWPALAWALFGASTFIPRSLTNHRWYKEHFGSDYPAGRRALVPFVL